MKMTSMAIDENIMNSLKALIMKSINKRNKSVIKSGVYLGTTAAMRTGGLGEFLTSIFVSCKKLFVSLVLAFK